MDEHKAMRSCLCIPEDQLCFVCLSCGKVGIDPSWCVLALSFLFLAIQGVRAIL